MKVIIFAGGTGTRLWPLSRKKSPKQFEKLVGDRSTFQLAIDRLLPDFKYEDIYVSSNFAYRDLIRAQVPQVPEKNLFFEPAKKDVAPAIALTLGILNLKYPHEPIAILWSDHLVKQVQLFKRIIRISSKLVKDNPNKIIFIGHKPRFPSINLGYIKFGGMIEKKEDLAFYEFKETKYRPDEKLAKKFFNSGNYAWNLGYFVTTPSFIYNSFKRFSPGIYKKIEEILAHYGKPDYEKVLKSKYHEMESISFDNAILEKLQKSDAAVVVEDIGWSDVGSWEALKEALQSSAYENVIRGKLYLDNVKDSLIYNYDEKKLIVGIDLDENIIINTRDVILIAKKTSMPKVKKLVEGFSGTEHEDLT